MSEKLKEALKDAREVLDAGGARGAEGEEVKTAQKEIMGLGFSKRGAREILHLADQRARKDLRRYFGAWPDGVAPGLKQRIKRERRKMSK